MLHSHAPIEAPLAFHHRQEGCRAWFWSWHLANLFPVELDVFPDTGGWWKTRFPFTVAGFPQLRNSRWSSSMLRKGCETQQYVVVSTFMHASWNQIFFAVCSEHNVHFFLATFLSQRLWRLLGTFVNVWGGKSSTIRDSWTLSGKVGSHSVYVWQCLFAIVFPARQGQLYPCPCLSRTEPGIDCPRVVGRSPQMWFDLFSSKFLRGTSAHSACPAMCFCGFLVVCWFHDLFSHDFNWVLCLSWRMFLQFASWFFCGMR